MYNLFPPALFNHLTRDPVKTREQFFDVFVPECQKVLQAYVDSHYRVDDAFGSERVKHMTPHLRDFYERAWRQTATGSTPFMLVELLAAITATLGLDSLDAPIELMKAKNHDYAGESRSLFGNLERHGFVGVLIRMHDKIARLETLAAGHTFEVRSESVQDTVYDLYNYSLLALALWSCGLRDHTSVTNNDRKDDDNQ